MINSKHHYFKDDIRKTFIIYALIPILITTVVSYLAVFLIWNKTIISQTTDSNKNLSYKLEETISSIINKTDEISVDNEFYKMLYNNQEKKQIYQELYSFSNRLEKEVDFYVFDNNLETLVSSTENMPTFITRDSSVSWGITKRMKENPYDVILECNKDYKDNIKVSELIIGKAITDKGEIQGYAVFILYGEDFIKLTGSLTTELVVTDKYDNIFLTTTPAFSNSLDKLTSEFKNINGYVSIQKDKYYVSKNTILEKKISVYTITSLGNLLSVFVWIGVFIIIVLVMLILGILIVANKIAFHKTLIIDKVVEAFEEAQKGNLDVSLDIKSYDEFEIIGEAYNMMLTSIKDLMANNEEKVRQTVLSEIKQLESQFNPHFLFNTLEHIKYMAKMDPNAAGKMIVSLSTLLRYSINNTLGDVTIKEDLEYTENYLQIQKYRFSNRFTYTIAVEEGTQSCIVPKLIIQPIIENAIKYGFEDRDYLSVKIKVCFVLEKLVIVIFDDGIGMEEELLNTIKSILSGEKNTSSHIGLYNVHRRIKLIYGDDYGINIKSEKFEGTVIKIILPINQRGE